MARICIEGMNVKAAEIFSIDANYLVPSAPKDALGEPIDQSLADTKNFPIESGGITSIQTSPIHHYLPLFNAFPNQPSSKSEKTQTAPTPYRQNTKNTNSTKLHFNHENPPQPTSLRSKPCPNASSLRPRPRDESS